MRRYGITNKRQLGRTYWWGGPPLDWDKSSRAKEKRAWRTEIERDLEDVRTRSRVDTARTCCELGRSQYAGVLPPIPA